MEYRITLNSKKIKTINNAMKMSHATVHEIVEIDESLLKEKDTWYCVDNTKFCFFKPRNDCRLAGECISEEFAKELGEETANYQVVKLNNEIGVLSENFHTKEKYDYYDFCNLYELFPSFPKKYNHFTLKSLLKTLEIYMQSDDIKELQQHLINRYVFSWFTHQLDGNPRNSQLRKNKLSGKLELVAMFDREQSFGINKNNIFDEKILEIWVPSIPYEDLEFRENPYLIDGVDANIMSLIMDYSDMTFKSLNWIFSVDYKKILKKFSLDKEAIVLPKETLSYFDVLIDKKKHEKEKIFEMF